MSRGNPRVTAALARLAILRQAPELTEFDFEVYAVELETQGVPIEHVEEACRRLGLTERGDGETAFPSMGKLLAECRVVKRDERARELEALAATAPKYLLPGEDQPVMTRAEARSFIQRLKADVDARRATNR